MKKELSKPLAIGLVAAAILAVGGVGWTFYNATAHDGEPSPALRDKQIEYQKSISPGANFGGKPSYVQPSTGGG